MAGESDDESQALGRKRAVKPFQHVVEGVGKLLELVPGPCQGDPLAEILLGCPSCCAEIIRTGRSTRPATIQPAPAERMVMTPRPSAENSKRLCSARCRWRAAAA